VHLDVVKIALASSVVSVVWSHSVADVQIPPVHLSRVAIGGGNASVEGRRDAMTGAPRLTDDFPSEKSAATHHEKIHSVTVEPSVASDAPERRHDARQAHREAEQIRRPGDGAVDVGEAGELVHDTDDATVGGLGHAVLAHLP
jgi:hypothetical protein